MSIKQGLKYDSPESAREISAFIAFHKLNVDEIHDPPNSFSECPRINSMILLMTWTETFNEFFYRYLSIYPLLYTFWAKRCHRKLKDDARPVASPNDHTVLVSGADCRMMAFESVSEATKLWIKGRDFTIATLLGPQYAGDVHKYVHGPLCIFRLAPQVRWCKSKWCKVTNPFL